MWRDSSSGVAVASSTQTASVAESCSQEGSTGNSECCDVFSPEARSTEHQSTKMGGREVPNLPPTAFGESDDASLLRRLHHHQVD